jgi:hypothetical protein
MFWLYAESALLMLIVLVVVWFRGRLGWSAQALLHAHSQCLDGRVDAIKGALIFVQAKMLKSYPSRLKVF